jgi:hypothetical protein
MQDRSSLTSRKFRPIAPRDSIPKKFRDDRLFFIACDDTFAPAQYFSFFRLPRIKIEVVPTIDGTSHARHVLDRLMEFSSKRFSTHDERWMILDTDHLTQPNHIRGFVGALKSAERLGVKVALSRPCFELWLLLHHCDERNIANLRTASEVETALRSALGEYNKLHLKEEHYPYNLVLAASKRARRLDRSVSGGMIPEANTTRIYQILNAIGLKALASQFPQELKELLTPE